MAQVNLAVAAMRSRFELVLEGDRRESLQAAGEEALQEILSIERLLHPFDPSSDLARVRGTDPVQVSGATISFLQAACELTDRTFGAFDLTASSGGGGFSLDVERGTVWLPRDGIRLDPGALGKGWALDRAAELLKESGVTKALLHGGTSSVVAIGSADAGPGWKIAVCDPGSPENILESVILADEALSVSSNFERLHIVDPRTGAPVPEIRLAVVRSPSAAEAEALSTALLVLGEESIPALKAQFPEAVLSFYRLTA